MPYSVRFGDHFFSRNDGCAESRHVFLNGNGLPQRWKARRSFQIAELGFGTGLNFLETWRQWRQTRKEDQHLSFTSFEAYPLSAQSIKRAISVWPELSLLLNALLEHWPKLSKSPAAWALDRQTTLTIIKAEVLSGLSGWRGKADAWYLDGFSPSNNRDMWSADLMQEVYDHTNKGGSLATYTSAGWVRRNLLSAGFTVEKVPAHANKRHMLIGARN